MRLSTKYFLVLAAFSSCALVAVSLVEGIPAYDANLEQMARAQRAEAKAVGARIEARLNTIATQIEEVNRLPWESGSLALMERRDEMLRLLKLNPAVSDLQVLSQDGKEKVYVSRLSLDRVGSGEDFSRSAQFLRTSATSTAYGPAYFRDSTDPYVSVTFRDIRPAADVVVAELNLGSVAELVREVEVGKSGYAYVVDNTNRLIAHPNASLLHRNLDLSKSPQVGLTTPNRLQALTEGVTIRVPSFDTGEQVVASVRMLPSSEWMVFVEQPVAEALAPILAAVYRGALLMVVLLVAALVGSLILARRLVAPILSLQRGVAAIRGGSLSARVGVASGDELASLADEFNGMAERLSQSYANLESKVALRTAALADTSNALEEKARQVESLNEQLRGNLAELESRNDDAQRASAAKTRFLAIASHDLRQPMHTISLLVGILRERNRVEETGELLRKIQISVEMMERLFDGLLDITRLDAGVVHVTPVNFDISEILYHIELQYAPLASKKEIALRVRKPHIFVMSDPILLERIIGNLVSNAVRYTDTGGVLVGCRRVGASLRILVADTGRGISPEFLETVFDEFVQLPGQLDGSREGLGLGLSIVRRSANLLGHEVTVRSRVARGSMFAIEVPRSQKQPGSISVAAKDVDHDRTFGAFAVVIDDDAENRYSMKELLTQWGCHVVAAEGSKRALEALIGHLRVPDLIVSDLTLHETESGFDAVQRIRELTGDPIPAIIVTGDLTQRLGEYDRSPRIWVVHKPVNPTRFRHLVESIFAITADAAD